MSNRRTFVKQIASTTATLAVGGNLAFGGPRNKESQISLSSGVLQPENPLILFDNFHVSNRASYSWKAKFAAAKHAGFDGFEFAVVDPETDSWKEGIELFWEQNFKTWGFHWTTKAVVDGKAPEIDAEIEKIIRNIELLAKMPIKPYFTLSLSGKDELSGATIAESGSAKADERHWERAYKIISAFDKACNDNNIIGSLYPHIDWICDTPQSAFKILKGAKANTIGSAFCSHHWYANKTSDDLGVVLANPYMKRLAYVVLTNAHFTPTSFSAVRFNEGEMDMAWVLAKLYEFGYSGPISTQGWGIGGDPFIACKQFVDTIRALRKRFEEHPELNPLN